MYTLTPTTLLTSEVEHTCFAASPSQRTAASTFIYRGVYLGCHYTVAEALRSVDLTWCSSRLLHTHCMGMQYILSCLSHSLSRTRRAFTLLHGLYMFLKYVAILLQILSEFAEAVRCCRNSDFQRNEKNVRRVAKKVWKHDLNIRSHFSEVRTKLETMIVWGLD